MASLDPDQAKLVRRSCNGPALICDAAGTGKTVVGLHHDACLARSTRGRVLFTRYLKRLCRARSSHSSSAPRPDMVSRVDFVGVRAFTTRLQKEMPSAPPPNCRPRV